MYELKKVNATLDKPTKYSDGHYSLTLQDIQTETPLNSRDVIKTQVTISSQYIVQSFNTILKKKKDDLY